MSETLVRILDARGRLERKIDIRVNGHDADFTMQSGKLAARFFRNNDDRLSDLIDIAGSIFAADSRISRGGPTRSDFGAHWRRRLQFRFSVRDPEFWSQARVSEALRAAVQFMSDDILEIEFIRAKDLAPVRNVLDVGRDSPVFTADDVIMFSGGLDSLTGAFEKLSKSTANVILISHSSAPKRDKYPRELFAELDRQFKGRILWIPVVGRLKSCDAKESTQRTRSFLFACLGYVAAQLSGARNLHFYENGIVSANLPISPQVIGSMASRTTHPQTLSAIDTLLKLVSPDEVKLGNPFGNLTKAQVVGRLGDFGGADLIRRTVSCSHVWERTILHPHCGACSQCLDRRFGILAAGLDIYDPIDGYEIDVLAGPRPTEQSRVLALDWTRHALRLTTMSDLDFAKLFGNELARLADGHPGASSSETARSIVAMHRLHGEGVKRALSQASATQSSKLIDQSLPPTSLLRMVVAEQTAIIPVQASITMPFDIDDVTSVSIDDDAGMKVTISGSAKYGSVKIDGLGQIDGVNATPAWALAKWFLEDKAAKIESDDFRFVPGGELSQILDVSKTALRGRVKRLRDGFADFYKAIEDCPPSDHILIKSGNGQNYRIDPYCSLQIDGDASE